MPRQPFVQFRKKYAGGNIIIGTPALGQRPELEAIIGKCLMAWPIAESELGLTLGQLLGIGSGAALAVFSVLRRSTVQREVVFAAAEVRLHGHPKELELLSAMLDVHKSIEAERNALAHGHFGTFDLAPDVILWMTAADYVFVKANLHLWRGLFDERMRDDVNSRLYVYKTADLTKIHEDILYCTTLWPEAINWLRTPFPQRDALYRQLCGQTRIARALADIHRKNTPSAQHQSPLPEFFATG